MVRIGIVTVLVWVVRMVIHYLFCTVSSTFNLLYLVGPTFNEHVLRVWGGGW